MATMSSKNASIALGPRIPNSSMMQSASTVLLLAHTAMVAASCSVALTTLPDINVPSSSPVSQRMPLHLSKTPSATMSSNTSSTSTKLSSPSHCASASPVVCQHCPSRSSVPTSSRNAYARPTLKLSAL